MTKDIDRRLGKLEKRAMPGRVIVVPDTPENRAAIRNERRTSKRRRKARGAKKRAALVGHRDIVVFMSEAELAL
ncbi:MAG: hypothetical protein F9K29_03365 [Hyphomicrobiaceae bacterium]|nr:MAG: hypothetical protein F9K29_03365 [Hyphomicrobiaceae bacterium]